ncbi:TPM domain-containing protein [Moheibacter sp. BDHS18]|uniref:TPM domain-containing protein n=2 Tax=Moheibacter lacus TaxID=2745851 RepID=A0A838ZN49_9FLAO|nr:TPM domain-containing protein [Moheibacter lacus]
MHFSKNGNGILIGSGKPIMKFIFAILLVGFTFIQCSKITSNENTKKIYTIENAESLLPKPIGLVNDFTYTFTQGQRAELEKFLRDYSKRTTNQIVIVTVDEIQPYTNINDYATDLGNYWGVGTAEKNNGLVIVLNMKSREIRISSGYGAGKVLSDEFLKKIIDEEIIPYFKQNNFYEGLMKGLNKIIEHWDKTSL